MRIGLVEFTTPPLVSGPKIVFTLFDMPISITVITTWVIIFLFYVFFKFGTRKLELNPKRFQVILESIYTFLESIVEQILGVWKNKYLTYFSTLFMFIFISNIITFFPIPWFSIQDGVLIIYPLFRSPTADLNTTVALAFITTVTFMASAIKYNGIISYLKGFASPTPIMIPMNIVGELAKPLNISMRLFGNMFAGIVIMGLLYLAVPWFVPAPLHLYFDLFAGAVQSFVFVTLSMVYVQGAIGDAEYIEN